MKLGISLILVFGVLTTNVDAAVISRTENVVSLMGDIGAEYKNAEVQLQILGPFDEQKSIEDSIFGESVTAPVFMSNTYINNILADENGKYSFDYVAADENKYYTIMVKEPGRNDVQYLSMFIPTAELEAEFLEQVNSASNANQMLKVFQDESYSDLLKGNCSDFSKIADHSILSAEMAEGVPYSNLTAFENRLAAACAVHLTNTLNSASEAKELAENKIDISSSDMYGTYRSLTDETKLKVFGRMLKNNFTDLSGYMNKFDESVFLEKIASEKYASNMTDIIQSNQSRFGFDLTRYRAYANEVNIKLYGRSYSDMPAFKAALANAVSEVESAASKSSGGGGGGGGGSSSGGKTGSGGAIIGATTPAATTPPVTENKDMTSFSDIDTVEWAKYAINELAARGVVSGIGDGRFAPMENVTREAFVHMIVKAFDLHGNDTDLSFDDVKENEWYYSSIKIVHSIGIINGMDNNKFGIGQYITRQDMAAIILRTAQKLGKSFEYDPEKAEIFADDTDISDYAKEAVYTLRNGKIISGVGENRFEPKSNATRAQAAVIIYTTVEALTKSDI